MLVVVISYSFSLSSRQERAGFVAAPGDESGDDATECQGNRDVVERQLVQSAAERFDAGNPR